MNKSEIKECKKHGMTSFRVSKNSVRCRKCSVEAVTKRRRVVKQKAIEYLGGKCADCGIESDIPAIYDFHHKDPKEKDFAISKNGNTRAWKLVEKELDKCVLLCSNCHRTRHYLEDMAPQVGLEPTTTSLTEKRSTD